MKSSAIVVAAGRGTRIGATAGKGLVAIGGRPMATYALRTLAQLPELLSIVLVVGADQEQRARSVIADFGPWSVPIHVTQGGAERQDSVAAGLARIEAGPDLIIVHDAARPFVPRRCFEACIAAAAAGGAAIAALPAHDTIKRVDTDGIVLETVDRNTIWLAQTPQVFRVEILRRAYAEAGRDHFAATDDAMLVERLGVPVRVVRGEAVNRKITTPDDLDWAESHARTLG